MYMYTTVYCVCCVCACTQLYPAVCCRNKQGCLVHDTDPGPGPLSKLPYNEPALRFNGLWGWGLPVLQDLEAVASQRIPLNSRPERLGLVCIAETCIPPHKATFVHISQNRGGQGGHSTVPLHGIVPSFGPAHLSAGGPGPCWPRAHEFQLHQVTTGWCSPDPLPNNRAAHLDPQEITNNCCSWEGKLCSMTSSIEAHFSEQGIMYCLSHNACVLIILTPRCNKALKLK